MAPPRVRVVNQASSSSNNKDDRWTCPTPLNSSPHGAPSKRLNSSDLHHPTAEIDTLLTVASRVPDHGKLAPWRFIVFEGEARRSAGEAIAAAFRAKYPDARPEHIAAERERLMRAPLVIAVVSRAAPHVKIPEWEQVLSAGAAAMNLVTRRARPRLRGKLDHRMVRLRPRCARCPRLGAA